jgi:hypothetical protein
VIAAGQVFTVRQVGDPCAAYLSYNSSWFPASTGSYTVGVSIPAGCAWTATPSVSWIQTAASGTGPGTVGYTLQANPSPMARTGNITVGGAQLTVNQVGVY